MKAASSKQAMHAAVPVRVPWIYAKDTFASAEAPLVGIAGIENSLGKLNEGCWQKAGYACCCSCASIINVRPGYECTC